MLKVHVTAGAFLPRKMAFFETHKTNISPPPSPFLSTPNTPPPSPVPRPLIPINDNSSNEKKKKNRRVLRPERRHLLAARRVSPSRTPVYPGAPPSPTSNRRVRPMSGGQRRQDRPARLRAVHAFLAGGVPSRASRVSVWVYCTGDAVAPSLYIYWYTYIYIFMYILRSMRIYILQHIYIF